MLGVVVGNEVGSALARMDGSEVGTLVIGMDVGTPGVEMDAGALVPLPSLGIKLGLSDGVPLGTTFGTSVGDAIGAVVLVLLKSISIRSIRLKGG